MSRSLLAGAALAACVAVALVAPVRPAPQARGDVEVMRSDLNHGSWVRGPDLPEARQDAAAVVYQGRIYLIGGYGPKAAQESSTLVLEPDLVTQTPRPEDQGGPIVAHLGAWTYAKPIPEAVDHAAAAALDGFIYVAGGRIEKLVTNKFWRYDPIADEWLELPSMPVPRYGPTMQAMNGKVFVIGGTSSHGNDERGVEIYDIASAQWTLVADALGVEREDASSVILGDRIAIVGGHDRGQHDLPYCDLWDPGRNRLSPCSNLHHARSSFGLAAIEDRLVAIGGEDRPDAPLPVGIDAADPFQVDRFTNRVAPHGQTMEISGAGAEGWRDGPWMSAPRQGMATVTLNRAVWVIGGAHSWGVAPTKSVLRYVSPLTKVKLGGRSR